MCSRLLLLLRSSSLPQFHRNKLHAEALSAYKSIVTSKYAAASRLRVNMGNIHFEQGNFPSAVKMYRMALDQVPPTNRATRMRIQRNLGVAFVRMGNYADAIGAFEGIMDTSPDFAAGFNLLLCYYALGDAERQKAGFHRLLALPLPLGGEAEERSSGGAGRGEEGEGEGEEEEGGGGKAGGSPLGKGSSGGKGGGGGSSGGGGGGGGGGGRGGVGGEEGGGSGAPLVSHSHLSAAGLLAPRDALRDDLVARQGACLGYIKTGARLIAPALDPRGWAAGYDWCVEALRLDHPHCASEVAIAKALAYLRAKQFGRAIEELKAFEKKDAGLKARAANNLSFLYLLEGDTAQAYYYADLAVANDRYSARALVNLGNALVERDGELERAKEYYLEAIGVEADCVEAIFNLGLVNRQLGCVGEAIQAFEKLHTLVPSSPEVLHHLALLHEAQGSYEAASKYGALLVSRSPTDSGALARLGQMYARMAASSSQSGGGGSGSGSSGAAGGGEAGSGAEAQAFHYTAEAYRVFPVNLDVRVARVLSPSVLLCVCARARACLCCALRTLGFPQPIGEKWPLFPLHPPTHPHTHTTHTHTQHRTQCTPTYTHARKMRAGNCLAGRVVRAVGNVRARN